MMKLFNSINQFNLKTNNLLDCKELLYKVLNLFYSILLSLLLLYFLYIHIIYYLQNWRCKILIFESVIGDDLCYSLIFFVRGVRNNKKKWRSW